MLLISPDRPQHDGVDRLSVSHGRRSTALVQSLRSGRFFRCCCVHARSAGASWRARGATAPVTLTCACRTFFRGSLGKIRAEHRFGPARHAERRDGFTVRQAVENVAFLFLHQHQVSIEQAPIETCRGTSDCARYRLSVHKVWEPTAFPQTLSGSDRCGKTQCG